MLDTALARLLALNARFVIHFCFVGKLELSLLMTVARGKRGVVRACYSFGLGGLLAMRAR